jgi:hypothetical protein
MAETLTFTLKMPRALHARVVADCARRGVAAGVQLTVAKTVNALLGERLDQIEGAAQ